MTMENHRVAVIVPCFNDGATVLDTIRSVREEQEACELVVVDDGSTDPRTLSVLDSLEVEGVPVIHQQNSGVSAARMTGVRTTSAPYVFPLDSDDLLVPGALTILADYLDANPDTDAVWGRLQFFGEKTHEKDVSRVLDPWAITYLNDIPLSALMRRDTLLAAGGWQWTTAYQDWDLWMSLAERGVRGCGLPLPVYRYRVHGPRLCSSGTPIYNQLYATLRRRHPKLFADRAQNRRSSPAPLLTKIVFPLLDAVWPNDSYRKATIRAALWNVTSRRGGYLRPVKRRLRRAKVLLRQEESANA